MTRATRLAAPFLLLAVAACGLELEPPPIELTYRDSLLGAGKIVQLKNTSNEPLTQVRVVIRAPDGSERTWLEETLGAYGELEVGWKKLDGWQVPPGAEVEVKADGFLRSLTGTIPADAG